MRLLKQNDTTKAIVFLMVDSADHITGKTGLSPTVTISKNGGVFSSPSGTVSEIGNGWYKLVPASTDVDTLGALLIHATATGADPVDLEYQVVAFDPYSATSLGLSNLDATISSRAPAATALSNAVWTDQRAQKLDNLDVAVSSRSTLTDAQVWQYSSRTLTAPVSVDMSQALPTTPTANTVGEALKFADTRLDATISSRADGSAYTPARAAKLDNLDVAVSSRSTLTDSQVWSYSSRTLTSSVDVNMSQGLPASPSPNTVGEALKFADTRLDATVSSRSSHAPADVWNYSTRTLTSSVTISMDQTLPATPSANTVGEALKFADTRLDVTVGSRLAASSYVAPDNAGIAAIKAQTDKFSFSGTGPYDVKATLDGEKVTVQTNEDKTGYSLTPAYDRAKDALKYTEYTAPDNASISAIKAQTDKLSFAGTGPYDVKATLDGEQVVVSTNNDKTGYSLSQNSIGSVADAVWDELRSQHTTTGTYGAVSEWAGGSGGGGTDWTDTEKAQIRHRLGIDGQALQPAATPSLMAAGGYTSERATNLDKIDQVIGPGTIPVNHNYGGTDNLRVLDPAGNGVDNVLIYAYLAEDYNAGRRTMNYVVARSITTADGRWERDMYLDAGVYVLVFFKQGYYGPKAVQITVA